MVREMTETNLRSAYGGESQAYIRYAIYADKAKKEGYPNVARLSMAASFSEKVHASNHFRNIKTKGVTTTVSGAIFGTQSTAEDLQAGVDGETFEVEEMYPAYKAVTASQGESPAEVSFSWALEAEKVHLFLYKKAKEAVDKGKDVNISKINVCIICGFTVEGDAPERCSVCGAKKEMFKAF